MWITTALVSSALLVATQMVQKKMSVSTEKWTQFECGFNSMAPTHLPFSFQFFLVALLFLIFDIEIALVLSYPTETSATKNTMMMFAFLTLLGLGLVYEWQKGKVDWSKWMGKVSLQETMV